MDDAVLTSRDGRGVVTLTMNRPANFNALSEEMLEALQQALDRLAADESARVVVLAAAGKAFCPGHNLKEMIEKPSLAYYQRLFEQCSRVMLTHPQAAGAGDRAGAGHRHRGRLPAGGAMRPGGGVDRGALRRQRRQLRAVLLHAQRAAAAQHPRQAGDGNAGHRRVHQRRRRRSSAA